MGNGQVPEGEEWRDGMERFLDEEARTGRLAWLEQELPAREERLRAVQAQCDRAETRLGEINQAVKEGEILLGILRDATFEARRDLTAIAEGR